jgi:hypothetical protein
VVAPIDHQHAQPQLGGDPLGHDRAREARADHQHIDVTGERRSHEPIIGVKGRVFNALNSMGGHADYQGMVPSSLALQSARAVARTTGASLLPVDHELPEALDGAILLVDHAPDEDLLVALAGALDRVTAVVLWAPGWDEATAVQSLGRHGFEHGSVELLGDPAPGALAILVATAAAAAALPSRPSADDGFRALAVMPAFNEADVIFHTIGALVSEGVDVYLIDHDSTDGTADAARPWLGRGLIHIESFPDDAGFSERNRHEMVWRDILRRVQDVTGEVESDWYLFVNADEFREAPWPDATLADALREADELGYSAVNFELYDFRPVDDRFLPGQDPREVLHHYEPPGPHDRLQIKAWKRRSGPVDLVHHGGHDILFEGKRVFPVPFILRHYPIRSSEHGRRKVLAERLARFSAEERADGWHVQYDHYPDGAHYLHDPATLSVWDGDLARANLLAGAVRQLLLHLCLAGADPVAGEVQIDSLQRWLASRGSPDVDLQQAHQRLSAAAGGAAIAPEPSLDRATRDLTLALEANARLRGEVVLAASIGDARAALPR